MIAPTECAICAKLVRDELIVGARKCRKHDALLLTYILNLDKSPGGVRDMIVSDLRGYLDLGATSCAADTLLVLRLFLFKYPEACERRDVCIGLSQTAFDSGLDGVR
ncbi:hypothetical protein [Methylosinus sp. KRF6]|uniref:hypothetical protein n=1 Tax=Methylosinus sp. KRF6 TaxID=2846853 RepID=UPI001C0AE5E7|nr:hypothetical protein [Methylosinus sp. KRF6]MBU3887993.1 hypothetical protein [Methylosinus sp. KRF6]